MASVTKLYSGTMLAMLPDCAVWFDGGLISISRQLATREQTISLTSHTHNQSVFESIYTKKAQTLVKSIIWTCDV